MRTKRSVEELAVFGGSPAFDTQLHVGRPNIGDQGRILDGIKAALDSRWLTNRGPLVQELERRIADYLGARHCIAVCNATVGLEILIRALGLEGEVIVPSFTFVATAHALQWLGVTPVFCDIDAATHTIDPRLVEGLVTPRTSAVIGVHLWGRPCEIDRLAVICRRHNLKLVFDAAHAFGCSSNGRLIGTFGDAEVFSFHATKFFNTFEGGAVVTNDDRLAEKVRLMQNFGFSGYDSVVELGTNGKMTEIAAAMGLAGLESLEAFVAVNRANYELYREELADLSGVTCLAYDVRERCNYQYVVLEIDERVTGVTRDRLMEILWAENVLARRYFYPGCHRMSPYREWSRAASLETTEAVAQRVLVLPTGTAVDADAVCRVVSIIRLVLENAGELNARLAAADLALQRC